MKKPRNAMEFLRFIGSNLICTPVNSSSANSGMRFELLNNRDTQISKYLNQKIRNNYKESLDTYFIPNNSQKTENSWLSVCFVDLDAGRDKNEKYFSSSKVNRFKAKMRKRINEFECHYFPFSVIVETRNGFQLYLKLNKDKNVTAQDKILWSNIQNKLYAFFKECGADSRVLKLNQIMRLPFSYWFKKWEGKELFYCKIFSYTGKTYNLSTISNQLANIQTITKSNTLTKTSEHWKYKKLNNKNDVVTIVSGVKKAIDLLKYASNFVKEYGNKNLAYEMINLAYALKRDYE